MIIAKFHHFRVLSDIFTVCLNQNKVKTSTPQVVVLLVEPKVMLN